MIPGVWYIIEENVLLEYNESKNEDLVKYNNISDVGVNKYKFLELKYDKNNDKIDTNLLKLLYGYKDDKSKIEIKSDYVVYLYNENEKKSKTSQLDIPRNKLKLGDSKSIKQNNKRELQNLISFDEGYVVIVECNGKEIYIKWKSNELISCHETKSKELVSNNTRYCINNLKSMFKTK